MTTHTTPEPHDGSSTNCRICGHALDPHILALVRTEPVPMGLACCPHPRCPCGWTWRTNIGRSTAEQIEETRRLVREALLQDGYPVPPWLAD
jgi:hypothetical protein